MEDIEEALRRAPEDVAAYRDRAMVRIRLGAYELALADGDRVVHLDPDNDLSYFDRGRIAFLMGQFDAAVVDVSEALRRNESRNRVHLWQLLALLRRDGPAGEEKLSCQKGYIIPSGADQEIEYLTSSTTKSFGDGYSYAERSTAESCMGHFLTGQHHIVRGRPDRARAVLEHAVDTCPKDIFEYDAAIAELRRLGPG